MADRHGNRKLPSRTTVSEALRQQIPGSIKGTTGEIRLQSESSRYRNTPEKTCPHRDRRAELPQHETAHLFSMRRHGHYVILQRPSVLSGMVRCSHLCETSVSLESKMIRRFIIGDTHVRRNSLQDKLKSLVLQNTDCFAGRPCFDVLPQMRRSLKDTAAVSKEYQ